MVFRQLFRCNRIFGRRYICVRYRIPRICATATASRHCLVRECRLGRSDCNGNPFLHVRLGQSQFDLGNQERATFPRTWAEASERHQKLYTDRVRNLKW